jgi:hypothetical protein
MIGVCALRAGVSMGPRQRNGKGISSASAPDKGPAAVCPPLSLGPVLKERDLSPEAPGPHSPVESRACARPCTAPACMLCTHARTNGLHVAAIYPAMLFGGQIRGVCGPHLGARAHATAGRVGAARKPHWPSDDSPRSMLWQSTARPHQTTKRRQASRKSSLTQQRSSRRRQAFARGLL